MEVIPNGSNSSFLYKSKVTNIVSPILSALKILNQFCFSFCFFTPLNLKNVNSDDIFCNPLIYG